MMGRKRKHGRDLPQRVYLNHGAYYFVAKDGEWIWLGKDRRNALRRYADLGTENPIPGRLSFIMRRYMDEWAPKHKTPRTIKNNDAELVPIKAAFGHMEPHEVTPTAIYQYMDARPRIAANREVALLSAIFGFAIRIGAASENPCRQVSRNTEKPRDRFIEDAEYQAIYDMASPAIKCAMDLARHTGLRLSDLLKLNERENVRDGGLYVETGKTGRKLLFEWNDGLLATLERCRKLRGNVTPIDLYLICNRDSQRYTLHGFSTMWQKLMKKAEEKKLARFQFRDLRALAASKSEAPTELLGHNDPRITNRVYRRGPRKVKPNK